jgi:hypothetical protein
MQYTYAPTRKRFPKAKMAKALAEDYTAFQKIHTSCARGAVIVERPLSLMEMRTYRMRPLKMPRVIHDMYGVRKNGVREYLMTLERPFTGYIPARHRAKETGQSKEFVDYVAMPRQNRR